MLDVVEALVGVHPTVVDVGCGTGTVTLRLLDRLPAARAIGTDVDPVLLAIARATFADDKRVRIATADLRQPGGGAVLSGVRVDAVVTVTALHWLSAQVVRRLYRNLAGLVRRGGVFVHAGLMPLDDLPLIVGGLRQFMSTRRDRNVSNGSLAWDDWWAEVGADPALRDAADERRQVFSTSYPAEEFSPPAEWHLATLQEASFTEAGVVWRFGEGGVVAATR